MAQLLDATVKFVTALADVLLGGSSRVPVPQWMDRAAGTISSTLTATVPPTPYLDLGDHNLALALLLTPLPPLLWNVLGPFEYYTRGVSRVVRYPTVGVYACAALIAALSVVRSALFVAAVAAQPTADLMDTPPVHAVGGLVFAAGLTLFLGAYYRLGITGTYLGDYFGLFREERITAFPFNVVANPMYDGSSLFHLGEALLYVCCVLVTLFPRYPSRAVRKCLRILCLFVTGEVARPGSFSRAGCSSATASAASLKSRLH